MIWPGKTYWIKFIFHLATMPLLDAFRPGKNDIESFIVWRSSRSWIGHAYSNILVWSHYNLSWGSTKYWRGRGNLFFTHAHRILCNVVISVTLSLVTSLVMSSLSSLSIVVLLIIVRSSIAAHCIDGGTSKFYIFVVYGQGQLLQGAPPSFPPSFSEIIGISLWLRVA